MQFRDFGKLDWKVSALGFGAMRMPTLDDDARGQNIDQPQAIRMIRSAVDGGVNYLDSAYVYHGGQSEVVVGKALRDGYRHKVRVATKSPVWMLQNKSDFDRFLNEQLTRLSTDHIDFYLLHALDRKRWREIILKQDVLECAAKAIADGRIGYLGFSFHDNNDVFNEILAGYDGWTFCQVQYNYLDTENQAGSEGIRLAADHGLAVVVMEPLLGGRLANPPKPIRAIIDRAPVRHSAVDWALQWLWSQPAVSLVLSGMSNLQQVEHNLEAADHARIHSFSPAELAVIAELQRAYRERTIIPCTKCSYCMPCKNGVNIPRNFELFNDAQLHEDVATSKFIYQNFVPPQERASVCLSCRECEELCPQRIPIGDWMPKVAQLLH